MNYMRTILFYRYCHLETDFRIENFTPTLIGSVNWVDSPLLMDAFIQSTVNFGKLPRLIRIIRSDCQKVKKEY